MFTERKIGDRRNFVVLHFGSVLKNAFEPRREKTNVLVSYLVRHKPGCTATEDGHKL